MRKAAADLKPLQVAIRFERFDRLSTHDCVQAFGQLLQDGCEALAVAPIQNTALRRLVDALAPGLPLVFFDTDLKCDYPHGFVGQDPYQGGLLAGRLLGLSVPEGAPLALIRFDEDDEHLSLRAKGFVASSQAQGRSVLELHQRLNASTDDRRLELARFVLAHPEARGLFVPNANVSDYARLGPTWKVVGYDLTPPNVRALKEGRIDVLISQRPEAMGAETIRRLGRNLLFGEALPETSFWPLDVVLPENLEGALV
jgi:LacI family transcriptional regulator